MWKKMSVLQSLWSILLQIALLMSSTDPSASLSADAAAAAATGPPTPPIVYTIAGSDSGGGAGIQADLHAIHAMGCHGCSAVTCLTAQNSQGVSAVHAPPVAFLRKQLEALADDLPPRAIKIGMLGSRELAEEVGRFLRQVKSRTEGAEPPLVVLDPVMITTSGHRLIDDEAKAAMIEHVFSQADVLTPNKFEAEALLGKELRSPEDVEAGARELLAMGSGLQAVLIKGGHSLAESRSETPLRPDLNATVGYAQDYFLSLDPPLDADGKERLCDGCRGVWLRTDRYDSDHTHGTGCTLSSAIASALALGHQQRDMVAATSGTGAARAIYAIDACCLAKAYVTAGIARGVQLGQGPGPVVHTEFPSSDFTYPSIVLDPKARTSETPAFLPMAKASAKSVPGDGGDNNAKPVLGTILPIVDTAEWVERLARVKGMTDIQLRIKNEKDPEKILATVKRSQDACQAAGVRLWINDYWEAAVEAGCFGVHLGQEDLTRCVDGGGLAQLHERKMALGVSTHSYAELSAAIGVRPSYISLGPVFGTKSKNVAFDPQGLATVVKWHELLDPDMPLVAIGGINDEDTAFRVKEAGADCIAVIGAVTKADDVDAACQLLIDAME